MKFNELVKEILLDKLKNFGFELLEESKGIVVLGSNKVKIRISFDYNRTKELEAEVILNSDQYFRPIRIYELAEYFETGFFDKSANQNASIEGWLNEALKILTSNNELIIKGDHHLLQKIEKCLKEKDIKYTSKLLFKQDVNKADKFFQSKDYKNVVVTLKPHIHKLSKSHKMKYDYAIKKLSEQP